MRVYISGRMSGMPDMNYPAFHAAAKLWRDYGWEVLNPAESFNGDPTLPYEQYVSHDIDLLRQCDAIALLPGWNGPGARGSIWEWAVAMKLLGLKVFDAQYPAAPVSCG